VTSWIFTSTVLTGILVSHAQSVYSTTTVTKYACLDEKRVPLETERPNLWSAEVVWISPSLKYEPMDYHNGLDANGAVLITRDAGGPVDPITQLPPQDTLYRGKKLLEHQAFEGIQAQFEWLPRGRLYGGGDFSYNGGYLLRPYIGWRLGGNGLAEKVVGGVGSGRRGNKYCDADYNEYKLKAHLLFLQPYYGNYRGNLSLNGDLYSWRLEVKGIAAGYTFKYAHLVENRTYNRTGKFKARDYGYKFVTAKVLYQDKGIGFGGYLGARMGWFLLQGGGEKIFEGDNSWMFSSLSIGIALH